MIIFLNKADAAMPDFEISNSRSCIKKESQKQQKKTVSNNFTNVEKTILYFLFDFSCSCKQVRIKSSK